MRIATLAFTASALFIGSAIMPAQAGSLVEKVLKWDASTPLPECSDAKVLKTITKRYNKAEKKNWKRGFDLAAIQSASTRRNDLRDDNLGEPPLIPTRYCEATASMSNGQTYSMHYIIEAKSGFVGVKWGAEFCIHGLDPWKVYNGRCRVTH